MTVLQCAVALLLLGLTWLCGDVAAKSTVRRHVPRSDLPGNPVIARNDHRTTFSASKKRSEKPSTGLEGGPVGRSLALAAHVTRSAGPISTSRQETSTSENHSPFEEMSDGSTLIVTVDGSITRVGADGIKLWTAKIGGPMLTSYQSNSVDRPYAILPQLDGLGVVYQQGVSKKSFTRIPMSVKTFAELVPLYSHTPDGINYRKEEQHSLVYIDWETGAVDVVGGEHGRQPRREIASPDRPQLFLRKITTTIFAADVYTREPIFNLSFSEYLPTSVINTDKVVSSADMQRRHSPSLSANDTLKSFSDGSVIGGSGRVQLDTLAFDAFQMSHTYSVLYSEGVGGEAGLVVSPPRSAAEPTVIFRKLPIEQHFGKPLAVPETTSSGSSSSSLLGGNNYYVYASSESGVCDLAVTRVMQETSHVDSLEVLSESSYDESSSSMLSIVNGGVDFGLFAVSYSSSPPSSPWVKGFLPAPRDPSSVVDSQHEVTSRDVGICFPADSSGGSYHSSYFDQVDRERNVSPLVLAHQSVCDARSMDSCPASSTYFIHEVVASSGRHLPPDSSLNGVETATSRRVGSHGAVDLDMIINNAAKHSAGSSSGDKGGQPSADTSNGGRPSTHIVNKSLALALLVGASEIQDLVVDALKTLLGSASGIFVLAAILVMALYRAVARIFKPPPTGISRVVGNIHITHRLLGEGSHGTYVFFGYTQQLGAMRPVAIKQMSKSNYANAKKEIENLTKIKHENIVNYYMCEEDENFVFLALQLCRMNLKEFVVRLEQQLPLPLMYHRFTCSHADSIRATLLQAAVALEHLHRHHVVHRDIKPHNILMEAINSDHNSDANFDGDLLTVPICDLSDISKFRLRISDLGLSKNVKHDDSSMGAKSLDAGAVGTIGWQAPEVIRRRLGKEGSMDRNLEDLDQFWLERQEKQQNTGQLGRYYKIDIFSLGCVYHYTLVPGCHPFGQRDQREENIVKGLSDPGYLDRTPDAYELIKCMTSDDPKHRPSAFHLCFHPFFWTSQKRLDFIETLYCRLKKENSKSDLLRDLEVYADPVVCRDILSIGLDSRRSSKFGWGASLDVAFQREIDNPPHGITYDMCSVYSCIRFIRHKKSHFDELDGRLKNMLSLPEGFMRYFESRLPKLFVYCVWFATQFLTHEKDFQKFNVIELGDSFFDPYPPQSITDSSFGGDGTCNRILSQNVSAVEVEHPVWSKRDLPLSVRQMCTAGPTVPDSKSGSQTKNIPPCRGYFISPKEARNSLADLQATEVASPGTHNSNPAPLSVHPSSTGDRWVRGLAVPQTPMTWEAAAQMSTQSRASSQVPLSPRKVAPLACFDTFFPPMDIEQRPLHIRKALEKGNYRVQLCGDWEKSGQESGGRCFCRYKGGQKKCDYAHGHIELRVRGVHRVAGGINMGRYVCGDLVDTWGSHS